MHDPRPCPPQELQRAVQLSPESGFEKYMYLGQLLEGEEALAATQKGVELLQQVGEAGRRTEAEGDPATGLWLWRTSLFHGAEGRPGSSRLAAAAAAAWLAWHLLVEWNLFSGAPVQSARQVQHAGVCLAEYCVLSHLAAVFAYMCRMCTRLRSVGVLSTSSCASSWRRRCAPWLRCGWL